MRKCVGKLVAARAYEPRRKAGFSILAHILRILGTEFWGHDTEFSEFGIMSPEFLKWPLPWWGLHAHHQEDPIGQDCHKKQRGENIHQGVVPGGNMIGPQP